MIGGLIDPIFEMMRPDEAGYYSGITPPDVKQLELMLNEYVQQGIITPEDAQYFAANPSAFEAIATDPALKDAQMNALSSLQNIGEEGGLNAQAKARLHDIAKEENVRERGARESIMQNAQARGQGGSGLEFLSLLKNQQESAGRAADRGTQVSADAEQRALEALMNSGNLAGNIREQDFGEKSRKAQAIDALNQFNTRNKMQVNQYNVGNRNRAQESNLDARQDIANKNVANKNAQQQYNKNLLVSDYERRMGRAGTMAGAANRDFDRIKGVATGFGNAASDMISGGMDMYDAQQMAKNKKLKNNSGWEY